MRYYVSRENGGVARRDDDDPNIPEHFIPMSQQEVQQYLDWVEQVKKAKEEGTAIPPMPKFGPAAFEEDAANVVAEVEAEVVETVEQPTTITLAPEEEDSPDDSEELLRGLLNDGEDG